MYKEQDFINDMEKGNEIWVEYAKAILKLAKKVNKQCDCSKYNTIALPKKVKK